VPLVYAAATSHAPGITAWNDAAPAQQRERIATGFGTLRERFEAARPDVIVLLTSEHWTNFFLDHMGAFFVGRAESYRGPVEPWLGIAPAVVRGNPDLATALIDAAYDDGFEVSFGYELQLDHGAMLPLHFLVPELKIPLVPVLFNALAAPQPSARRCYGLGRVIGELVARRSERVAIVATGGMSHDPGERGHGRIDSDFDRTFLGRMAAADVTALTSYRNADFAAAGSGAYELLAWIALRGAIGAIAGSVVAYEPVVPWATGIGMMTFAA